jgi:hypothetical protein
MRIRQMLRALFGAAMLIPAALVLSAGELRAESGGTSCQAGESNCCDCWLQGAVRHCESTSSHGTFGVSCNVNLETDWCVDGPGHQCIQ